MEQRINTIKQKIELLPLTELINFIDQEIETSRIEIKIISTPSHASFFPKTVPEKRLFDRLVYFKSITKEFESSISECKLKLRQENNQLARIEVDADNKLKDHQCLILKFKKTIKEILQVLSDGVSIFSIPIEEPLKQLDIALDTEKQISQKDIENTLNSINYKPYGIDKHSNQLFVIEGEFERYLALKESLKSIYSDLLLQEAIHEVQDELDKKRIEINNKRSEIREQWLAWRRAAITCFCVQYTDVQLSSNSLLLDYE